MRRCEGYVADYTAALSLVQSEYAQTCTKGKDDDGVGVRGSGSRVAGREAGVVMRQTI